MNQISFGIGFLPLHLLIQSVFSPGYISSCLWKSPSENFFFSFSIFFFPVGTGRRKNRAIPPCAHQIIPANPHEGDHTVFNLTIIWAELAEFTHLESLCR